MADPQPDASGDLPAKKTRTPDAHAMRGEGYGIRYSAMHAMQQEGNSSGRQGGRKKRTGQGSTQGLARTKPALSQRLQAATAPQQRRCGDVRDRRESGTGCCRQDALLQARGLAANALGQRPGRGEGRGAFATIGNGVFGKGKRGTPLCGGWEEACAGNAPGQEGTGGKGPRPT